MAKVSLALVDAPGLPADWLNAWLAAIGVTALLPNAKLSWTDEVVPHAVFWVPDGVDLAQAVYDALPSEEDLGRLPIARTHPDSSHEFPRQVTLEAYRDRARIERRDRTMVLAASVSDLAGDRERDSLPHSPFDTPAPRGETLWSRLVACRRQLDSASQVAATFQGVAARLPGNGLGFDCRRAPTGVPAGSRVVHVDPVIELLAFNALSLFPIRGDGKRERTRCWSASSFRPRSFVWFSWSKPLDVNGLDAVLDQPGAAAARRWAAVPYVSSNPSDVTRAYFSEPVD